MVNFDGTQTQTQNTNTFTLTIQIEKEIQKHIIQTLSQDKIRA